MKTNETRKSTSKAKVVITTVLLTLVCVFIIYMIVHIYNAIQVGEYTQLWSMWIFGKEIWIPMEFVPFIG